MKRSTKRLMVMGVGMLVLLWFFVGLAIVIMFCMSSCYPSRQKGSEWVCKELGFKIVSIKEPDSLSENYITYLEYSSEGETKRIEWEEDLFSGEAFLTEANTNGEAGDEAFDAPYESWGIEMPRFCIDRLVVTVWSSDIFDFEDGKTFEFQRMVEPHKVDWFMSKVTNGIGLMCAFGTVMGIAGMILITVLVPSKKK